MKKLTFTILFVCCILGLLSAATHTVTVTNNVFTPSDLTIQSGDTVVWQCTQGFHNVNGSLLMYPGNPEGFSSGQAANAPWSYAFVFTLPGTYDYHCDPHFSIGMAGTITVEGQGMLLLTGVYDGPLPGGLPKGVELYVVEDIADLSRFGIGSANNGGGSDGEEYTFPAVPAVAGDFIYLCTDGTAFEQFFGFTPDFVDDANNSSVNINGDDAIELFFDGGVIDVFGDIDTDGTGTPWEHLDGWAYRVNSTGPDGSDFTLGNWFFSGVDAFDNQTTNSTSPIPFPIGTYSLNPPNEIIANEDMGSTDVNTALIINLLNNDLIPNDTITSLRILSGPDHGTAMVDLAGLLTYEPETDYCGPDELSYEVCFDSDCDTADLLITVNCPSSYPRYPVAVVTTNDSNGVPDSLGRSCELKGIVYGVNLRPGGLQFTLIDDQGDGIGVFNDAQDFGYAVTEGDEILVRGSIGFFNGLTQILAGDVEVVSTGNPLADPQMVSQLGENTESQLIQLLLEGIKRPSEWTNSGPGFNSVWETVTGDSIEVRIDDNVNIYGTQVPPPFPGGYTVIGIGGQYDTDPPHDDGYQLLPRYLTDIRANTAVRQPEWVESFSLAPNPVRDQVRVSGIPPGARLVVYNVHGQALMMFEKLSGSQSLDLSTFRPGTYFFHLLHPEGDWTFPVIRK